MRSVLIGVLLCSAFTASCKLDKGPVAPAVAAGDHPAVAAPPASQAEPGLADPDFCRRSPPPGYSPEYCRRCPGVCSTHAASGTAVPEIRPSEGIGPVRLGMSQSELLGLRLPEQPDPGGASSRVKHVGPYRVVFDDSDKVSSVEIDLARSAPGVRVGSQTLPAAAPASEVARVLQCGPVEHEEGGNVYRCPGQILVKIGSGGAVAIQVTRPG